MTMGEVYLDILQRAGEGYANYLDRAREMFWRALTDIIKSGQFSQQEAEGITTLAEAETELLAYTFNVDEWNYTDTILHIVVQLAPHVPDDIIYTYVTPESFPLAPHKVLLLSIAGIIEVLWTAEYPRIKIAYDAENLDLYEATCLTKATIYGVPAAAMTDAQDHITADTYIGYSLLIRTIEEATKLIIQELRG